MDRQVNGSGTASVPLKRNPGSHLRTLELWGLSGDVIRKLAYSALLGFVVFSTLRLIKFQFRHVRYTNPSRESAPVLSLNEASASEGSFITSGVRKHFENLSKLLWLSDRLNSNSGESDKHPAANDITAAVCKQKMDIQEAEALVKQWQDIKSEALGPDYQTDMLPEILDGSMLSKVCLCVGYLFACAIALPLFILCVIKCNLLEQWQDLALLAKDQSCYWRFVLLNLNVVRAEIILDEVGAGEAAEIDAVLEEAAELVDDSQPKKPSYYRYFQ